MSAPGLENGLNILEFINEHNKASFTQLKEALQLNGASLSRFLKVLIERDFIQKEDQLYILGRRFNDFNVEKHYEHCIYPLLLKITELTECSAIWIKYVHGRCLCIEKVSHPNGISMLSPGTTIINYLVNPSGYIYLAHQDESTKAYLCHCAQTPDRSIESLPSQELQQYYFHMIDQKGYMDDEGKIIKTTRRAGIPFYSLKGKLEGCVVIAGVQTIITDDKMAENIHIVQNELKSLNFHIKE